MGFDAALEFPPHGLGRRRGCGLYVASTTPDLTGTSTTTGSLGGIADPARGPTHALPGVTPVWDNTPRVAERPTLH